MSVFSSQLSPATQSKSSTALTEIRVELAVPLRLRRAIVHNDVLLVKRIVRNNPGTLTNPDHADRGNTSLHLAALKGHLDVVKLLVSLGHDSCVPMIDRTGYNSAPGISLNTDSSTPLHLAAAQSHVACIEFLCKTFPHTIDWPDKGGLTPLMLAARASNPTHAPLTTSIVATPTHRRRALSVGVVHASEDTATINALLAHSASLDCRDKAGNTALHYASAWGNLKAVRVLLAAGATSLPQNQAKHTPLDYSLTAQAARYFQNLMVEFERPGNHAAGEDHDLRRPSVSMSAGRATSPVQTRGYPKEGLGGKAGPPSSVRLVLDSSPRLDTIGRGEYEYA